MTLVEPQGAVDALVAEIGGQLDRWHVPGLELVVVRDGAVLFAGGIGVRGVDDPAEVTASTLFHHGSCGKAFTGVLAALLAADGALDLDAPLRRYVPELRLPDPVVADRVTLRDLLSHRSGLARHDIAWIFNPSWTREDLVRRLEHLPLRGDLRAQWEYSNLGYALAGLAIGRAAGSTWEEQLRTRVLAPLGLRRTFVEGFPDGNRAQPHLLRDDKPTRTPDRAVASVAPAGGLVSCADDTARWLLLHSDLHGDHTGEPSLDAAVVASTHQPQVILPADLSPFPQLAVIGYAFGWLTATFRGRRLLWHSGGIDGFLTQTVVLPEQRIGVLACVNLHMSNLPMAVALHVADALLGEKADPSWFDRLDPRYGRVSGSGDAAPPEQRTAGVREPTRGPVHILSRYAGVYRDPGYGDITVAVRGDELSVRVGEVDMATTHRNLDTWDLHYDLLDVDFPVTFVTDADGQVAEAVIPLEELPLEDATGPTRFRRVPATNG